MNPLAREHIILPALCAIQSYCPNSESLLDNTAIVETGYRYVRQINGPALSWWQMEPRTHDDLFANFLGSSGRQYLLDGLNELSSHVGNARELEVNPWYAAAMVRIFFLRFPEPLPDQDDLKGQAHLWKRKYNTMQGAGSEGDFLERVTDYRLRHGKDV